MRSPGVCISVAILSALFGAPGCAEKGDTSGQQLSGPPVAPLPEQVASGAGGASRPGEGADRPANGGAPPNQARSANWPFRPTSVRLHPLTHAVRAQAAVSTIDARIEFFDRFGHTSKGLGVVRFELHGGEAMGPSRRIASWEIDVRDVEQNMRHYDDVTHTYLFRLGLGNEEDLPATARLDVTVTMPNQKMSGSIDIALR